MVSEWLLEAGIRSLAQMSSEGIRLGAAAPRDIYVAEKDYDRAVEVLNAEVPSEEELAALSEAAATQSTQPDKGDPVDIPIPKRDDFEKLVRRAAPPNPEADEKPGT